jgi:hypothetical protein
VYDIAVRVQDHRSSISCKHRRMHALRFVPCSALPVVGRVFSSVVQGELQVNSSRKGSPWGLAAISSADTAGARKWRAPYRRHTWPDPTIAGRRRD